MNAQQAENLRTLIRHMETRPVKRLYMLDITHACGSPSCAMGHARTVPQLAAQCTGHLYDDACKVFGLAYDGEGLFKDPSDDELRGHVYRLFGISLKVFSGATLVEKLREPTPQEWAAEARKVLAEHGYTMDDTKAAEFVAGLERLAREPMPVTTEHGTALFPK